MGKRTSEVSALWPIAGYTRQQFIDEVWGNGDTLYRDLPWRNIDDAYGVLVSEVMLQQTQVKRVLSYWPRFMAVFPTVDALASASTGDVLSMWQGLGYNRRALALKRAADYCSAHYQGKLPSTYEELIALPGIGPATAAGVLAFSSDAPGIYLETNVRTVFLHVLFPDTEKVGDKELAAYVLDTCPRQAGDRGPRAWYYALLDYGAHIKQTTANPSRRSASYSKQSKFEGSHRQKRSELVRIVLAQESISREQAERELKRFDADGKREPLTHEEFDLLVQELAHEGFFTISDSTLVSV